MSRQNDIWQRKPAGLLTGFDWSGSRLTSPDGQSATLVNGASVNPRYLTLDGTDDYATVAGAASNDLGSAFTVTMWFQPASPGSVLRSPYAKWNTTASRRSYFLGVDYTALQRFGCLVSSDGSGSSASTCIYYTTATTPPTSGWNFIAWTYDSSRGTTNRHKLYLNGAWQTFAAFTDNAVAPLVTPDPLYIGQGGNNSAYWKGDIGPTLTFGRILADSEIAQIYNAGAARIALGGTP